MDNKKNSFQSDIYYFAVVVLCEFFLAARSAIYFDS